MSENGPKNRKTIKNVPNGPKNRKKLRISQMAPKIGKN